MVWDGNRNRVVTVSADGTARLWDTVPTDRGVELHHDEKVLGSAYSRDGARLLTWSADHTARVWDVGKRSNAWCYATMMSLVARRSRLVGGRYSPGPPTGRSGSGILTKAMRWCGSTGPRRYGVRSIP
jgi:WD40 repeat protein